MGGKNSSSIFFCVGQGGASPGSRDLRRDRIGNMGNWQSVLEICISMEAIWAIVNRRRE